MEIPTLQSSIARQNPVLSHSDKLGISGTRAIGAVADSLHNVSAVGKIITTSTREGMMGLGAMALGKSSIREWSSKGIEISEESLIAAAKAFQDAFKQAVEQKGSQTGGTRVSINKHQVVMNNQQVPEWFSQEYDAALAMIDNPARQSAFKDGGLFFVSLPVPTATDQPLAAYHSVAEGPLLQ